MKRRLFLVVVLGFVSFIPAAFGLELTNGQIRLVLFENTGRFSASYKPSGGEWTPLFYAQDPRTTALEIRVGNDLYRMGDSSRFEQKVTKTSSGGEITWSSSQLSVSESFAFKTSVGASKADGFTITVRVTNKSAKSLSVGLRYLIDTYLGEQNRIEFVTPTENSMPNETSFSGSQVPDWWLSPENKKMTVALETVTRGSGVTVPNRVIFANWKRLYDSEWDFTVDHTRNFNLLPYSINDSAVAMYYNPQQLAPGASRTVSMLMGQNSKAGWGTAPASGTTTATVTPSPTTAPSTPNPAVAQLLNEATAPQQTTAPSNGSTQSASAAADNRSTVSSDLNTVNGVLEQIQQMLASPGGASQADIDALGKVLDKLKARKSELSQ